MVLILMYHRAGDRALGDGNTPEALARHFRFLRDHCLVTVPGGPLPWRALNVCLTFDDAYADFYFRVFPLLQQFSLRAVLAVPTKFILEGTQRTPEQRMAVPQAEAMREEIFAERAPFCTWPELRSMQASGLVQLASHSHSHASMKAAATDVTWEAEHSCHLLENNSGCRPRAFVYPFGSVNRRARQAVRQVYEFDLRVGSALNRHWQPPRQPLSRLPADDTPDLGARLRWYRWLGLAAKMAGNYVRAAAGKWGA